MNNTVFHLDVPPNEALLSYAPGSQERSSLQKELARQYSTEVEIPLIIGGKDVHTGKLGKVAMPCKHGHVLATYHQAGEEEVRLAITCALEAKKEWETLSWVERASIHLKAAHLLSTKYRWVINAATMLGQGKSVFQAEVDAACETIDYLRYNAYFASQIYSGQPRSGFDQLNRMEYRPLEGFIFTVTPFNFTAIGSNLNMAVNLMGNVSVWKPATTALLSNYYLMRIFQEAGMPDGVLNFVPGSGSSIGKIALSHPDLSGVHFTGSNATFNHIWKTVAANLENLRTYPRLVGETGGKDFIFVHNSSDPAEVATAIVRGAYEYQGQKCSAASRSYIPRSLWPQVRDHIGAMLSEVRVGDVRDFGNFVNAVIDEPAFDNIMGYIAKARSSSDAEIVFGGTGDKSEGYYIQPTLILAHNPHFVTMEEEIFGPVMTVYIYDDAKFDETLDICNATSPYALTGAVFSRDRYVFVQACRKLRYAAGNFYLNDKPTGAMVGLQPFGGSRASGTNDKAGGPLNLMRWISPRTIKETFCPPSHFAYPFLSSE